MGEIKVKLEKEIEKMNEELRRLSFGSDPISKVELMRKRIKEEHLTRKIKEYKYYLQQIEFEEA